MKPEDSQQTVADANALHKSPTDRKAKRDMSDYSAFEDEVNRINAGDFLEDFAQQERS
jgi:hypothetical protein